uniref:Rhodanese domain-containing protein n=1 Tax=Oryza meridionalis TaxID=40149 RepID=A0A0E0D0I7_9ORYZ
MAAAVHRFLGVFPAPSTPTPPPPPRQLSPRPHHIPPSLVRCCSSSPVCAATVAVAQPQEFVVVTFYRFVPIDDPRAEVSRHLHFLQGRDIHGRIYMNEQGINAQYSGPHKDAVAYADWLRKDHRFCDLLVQTSPSLCGHAFPRLKLRYKPSLVQLEGGCSHLPLVDPSMRATPLTPSEWRERLETRKCLDMSSSEAAGDSSGRRLLLLDVRNDYEWDIGHFQGAQRPNVDCFRSTSFGLSESEQEMDSSDPLNGINKENTDILMYCTGGIRCDVYSTILRKKGFRNLYTLKGGVSNYLMEEGSAGWVGNLFVFDGRLSLPPATYKPGAGDDDDDEEEEGRNRSSSELGRCYACGSEVVELRHRNCANIDCNRLYLCCGRCVEELRGCCGEGCTAAPRLRPLLPSHQRYHKWHLYRHLDLGAPSSPS